ncbi:MAG TPA: dTMP kinase [Polyangiaceae bacterium]|nr:dTMP kinase [Polyangiaceae bacterium]
MSPLRGRFIVLEGTDGSGTTTQCARLVEWLNTNGVAAIGTREPTSGPIGRLLRSAIEQRLVSAENSPKLLDWASLALLFAADRVDHAHDEICPALARGVWVVSDRYELSSLIYQSLTAPDPAGALEWVRTLNAKAERPDLTLVLDVDSDTAEARRRGRGGSEDLFEGRELQIRLVEAYRHAELYSGGSGALVHIDGTSAPAQVTRAIIRAVQASFHALAPATDSG